ncbi:hypothetical protein LR48_Vigan543s002000 [Vigna angularis]|uniref:Uncharacterized protein n=1 Tax=Phaseolus angularis TaxID=3914 RepID=A0A0L9TD31_PHAAN|nr:hypothetical protein LR48_Vigan543s002000 [Vigna angularis]
MHLLSRTPLLWSYPRCSLSSHVGASGSLTAAPKCLAASLQSVSLHPSKVSRCYSKVSRWAWRSFARSGGISFLMARRGCDSGGVVAVTNGISVKTKLAMKLSCNFHGTMASHDEDEFLHWLLQWVSRMEEIATSSRAWRFGDGGFTTTQFSGDVEKEKDVIRVSGKMNVRFGTKKIKNTLLPRLSVNRGRIRTFLPRFIIETKYLSLFAYICLDCETAAYKQK